MGSYIIASVKTLRDPLPSILGDTYIVGLYIIPFIGF